MNEWERLFDAWVKHQAGQPSEVPLWPNPDWSQEVAMVAHALSQQAADSADAQRYRALRANEELERIIDMVEKGKSLIG